MRVFLSVTSLDAAYGGPARSVSSLAIALAGAGLDVGVWAADQSASRTPFLGSAPGINRLTGSLKASLASFGRPDVIHDNGVWPLWHHHLATFASPRRIPRMVSTRGMLEPWAMRHKALKKRVPWWLYQRRDLTRAACHHATTAAEAANLQRLHLGVPVRVIPNGIDLPPAIQHDAPGRMKTALFLGRIYPVKGLPMLIEAWARVRPDGWRLQIAGPDEAGHRAQIEALVRKSRLGDVVEFTGPIEGEAKRAAFAAADLFVLPSHSESFGIAVAEALAHGLPVLTTTAAPWPTLQARGCGWQVDANEDAMAEGLRVATSHSVDGLRSMGEKGRAFAASEFAWPGIADQFIAAYSELAAR